MVTIDSPRRFLCIRQHSYCQEGGSPANSMKVVKRVEVRNQLSGFPSRKRCAYGRGCEYRRCRIDKLTIKTRANLGTQEGNGDAWECVKGADWAPVARPAVKAPRYVQTQKGMPSFIDPIPADPCPDCQGSGKTTCGVCRLISCLIYYFNILCQYWLNVHNLR